MWVATRGGKKITIFNSFLKLAFFPILLTVKLLVLFHLAGPNNPVVNALFARSRVRAEVGSAQRITPENAQKRASGSREVIFYHHFSELAEGFAPSEPQNWERRISRISAAREALVMGSR